MKERSGNGGKNSASRRESERLKQMANDQRECDKDQRKDEAVVTMVRTIAKVLARSTSSGHAGEDFSEGQAFG